MISKIPHRYSHNIAPMPSQDVKKKHSPLPPQRNNRPIIPLLIHLLLDLRTEGDGRHDAVAKLLVQHGLVGVAVVLHDLVQSVDQRLDRRHGPRAPAVRETQQLGAERGLGDVEDAGERADVCCRGLRLPVEERGHGHLGAPQLFGDAGEGEGLGSFGVEEGLGGGREAVDQAGL